MDQPTTPDPPTPSLNSLPVPARSPRFRVGAAAAILVGVGLLVWLAIRDTGGGTSTPGEASVSAASVQELRDLASSAGHPIYWAGAKPGYTYELTRKPDGSILVRYLPPGVKVGSASPYLTVGTYPFPNALAAIEHVTGRDIVSFNIPNGGAAEYTTSYPESVHLAYPGSAYQVEVYDPSPATARQIVTSGQLSSIG